MRITITLDGSGGSFSCPSYDTLTMVVGGVDDSFGELIALVYIGDTSMEVQTAELPQWIFPKTSDPYGQETFILGQEEERDGQGFSRDDLCFAVAWMDRSGNIGEKSDVECISTVNTSEAYITTTNAGCSSTGPNTFGLFALVGGLLVLTRRKRKNTR